MKGQEFSWFIGEVRDINDPEGLNRVKVLPFSYYNKTVSNEYLPWSTVMMPNTLASFQGIGGNHQLIAAKAKTETEPETPGSYVVGFFRDAPACQDAVIMGSIATQYDTGEVDDKGNPKYKKDIPDGADINNKIYTTEGGQTLSINNKDGKESIRVEHPTGSSITMTPDGDIVIKSVPGRSISLNGSKEYGF